MTTTHMPTPNAPSKPRGESLWKAPWLIAVAVLRVLTRERQQQLVRSLGGT